MGLQVGSTLFPFLFLCLWTALSSAPLSGTTMASSPILETGTVEARSRAFWGGVGLDPAKLSRVSMSNLGKIAMPYFTKIG